MPISYSMCWEDPDILLEALNISNKDNVLTITSGGENLLAILLKNPNTVVAIDINKEQIYLTKLKIYAIQKLNFEEFIQFLGFKSCSDRVGLFNKIKGSLNNEELRYWNSHLDEINKGIIHCGKLERYLSKFRKYFLPFIISKKRINEFLLLDSIDKQKEFYRKYIDNWRFRLLFKIFFSRKGLESGRDKDYFKYSSQTKTSNYYLGKVRHGLTEIPIKDNFFMQYILIGTIIIPLNNHPYLDIENFNKLKLSIKRIKFFNADIHKYVKKEKSESFNKFNLSDVFEVKTQEEYEEILKEIVRVSYNNGLVCYWNNLVPRYEHDKVLGINKDELLSSKLSKRDRCHFYSRFIVEKITKK